MIKAMLKDDAESILGVLYDYFAEHQGLDNTEIKEGFEKLYEALSDMKLQETDKIVDIVCNLCQVHQSSAFAVGVKTGVKLAKELQ